MIEQKLNSIEFRALEEDNKLKIVAKVNDYNKSKMMRDKNGKNFVEIAPKEMWQRCLHDGIKVFLNHKNYVEIGNSHTFEVRNDGVYMEVVLDPTKEKGIYENVKQGILSQVSFGFKVVKDSWKKVNDYFERTLEDIKISEISLLDCTAAYNSTSIECRNLEVPNTFNKVDISLMKLQIELLKLKG